MSFVDGAIGASASDSLIGKVWKLGAVPEQQIPSIRQKCNLGIAIGGGGMRAACLSLGWISSLNRSGVLQRAKYISTAEGSSWVTEPILWAAVMEHKKKGQPRSPSDSDVATRTTIEFACQRIRKVLCSKSGYSLLSTGSSANEVASAIFACIDGNGERNYTSITTHGDHANSVLPYFILNSAVCSIEGKMMYTAPFEFTPLYCGIPIDPRSIHSHAFGNLRGGFVHRSVLGSDYATMDSRVVDGHATLFPNETQFKLSKVSTIEFNPTVQPTEKCDPWCALLGKGTICLKERESPLTAQYWAYDGERNLSGDVVTFANSASVDDTGILALLRRNVTEIVALCPIGVDIGLCTYSSLNENLRSYMGLFGVAKRGSTLLNPELYNNQRSVFEPAEWDNLIQSLRLKRKMGQPLIVSFSEFTVKENLLCGVQAGKVNITFVFNGHCENFDRIDWRALENKSYISYVIPLIYSSKKCDEDFPFIKSEIVDYTQDLVDALRDLAGWSLDSYLPELSKHLDMASSEYGYL